MWYLSLPPGTHVMKLFTKAIYCHPKVSTVVMLSYNTVRQPYHGNAENYSVKYVITFAQGGNPIKLFTDVIYEFS